MARAALNWSQLDLAARAKVGSTSVKKFELGAELRPALLEKLRRSMEEAGAVFIDDGDKAKGRLAAFGVFIERRRVKEGAERSGAKPEG